MVHMTWKGNKVRKDDVTVAKNYLTDAELEDLNQIVTMYLDYAELQARRHKEMYMKDWAERLDAFLQFNEQDILKDSGKVSRKVAEELAEEQYEEFEQKRLANPEKDDFDNFLEQNGLK